MLPTQIKSLFERAAADPEFRARLLANPALGLTAEKLQAFTNNPELAEAELSLDKLDQISGGPMSINRSGDGGPTDFGMPALDAA